MIFKNNKLDMNSNQDLKAHLVQPGAPVYQDPIPVSASSVTIAYQPPLGIWRDGICNCFVNLWPSCCCVFLGSSSGGFMPVFLSGQISTRLGLVNTKVVIVSYVALCLLFWTIAIIISLSGGSQGASVALVYIPYIMAFVFFMWLRFKFVEHYQISESGFETFCTAFWCYPCSLCQMARHTFGYNRILDGDGALEADMVYPPAPSQV